MTYLPNPTVNIAGLDYTGDTVDTLDLRRGRDTVYAQPTAGYGSIGLINLDDLREPVVGDPVAVTIEDSSGSPKPLFTGFIADLSAEAVATSDGILVRYKIQVVGLLARLLRRTVLAAGSPAELDGARVAAAVGAGLPVTWGETSTLATWADIAADVTWATFDPGFDPTLIDPGTFDLTALAVSDSGYSALEVASQAGESGKGLLFETPNGFVGYADADRRPANAAAGTINIPFSVLQVGSVSVTSSLSDLTNRVVVEYGANDAVTEQDDFSIGQFGLQARIIRTSLADLSNAQARAEDFLFSHSRPLRELREITVNLRADIGNTLRDDLIEINSNDAITITGAPESILPGGFRGFIEGVVWKVNDFEATVTLFASNDLLSFGSVLWGQVAATIAWQDVDVALTWADARRVTV